jgi:hypothetical protein
MERYEVYRYDLPKVEDGKELPGGKTGEKSVFASRAEAEKFMDGCRKQWDRIVLFHVTDAEEKASLRYRDGEIEPFPPPRATT